MAFISEIKLPNNQLYNIRDARITFGTSSNTFLRNDGSWAQVPNSNLVNGSATGSLRSIGSATEDSSYTIGAHAFAVGELTKASGQSSHASGIGTIAQRQSQTVIGTYNKADTEGTDGTYKGKYAFIIGNGTSDTNRNNAFAVTWDGNMEMAIDEYTTTDSVDQKLYDAIVALGWESDVLGFSISKNLSVHGSWIDSGTIVDDNKVYKSNASYHVANAWDTAKITFTGFETFTVYIRSYAESTYDYVLVSTLDNDYLANQTSATDMRNAYNNTTYTKAYTRGKQSASAYEEVTFTNIDPTTEHYFYIIYQKDSSSDSNDDRGYFYFPYRNVDE